MSVKGFRIPIVNILRVLMKEVGNVQEQVGYVHKETDTMRNDQREKKNALGGLRVDRLDKGDNQ